MNDQQGEETPILRIESGHQAIKSALETELPETVHPDRVKRYQESLIGIYNDCLDKLRDQQRLTPLAISDLIDIAAWGKLREVKIQPEFFGFYHRFNFFPRRRTLMRIYAGDENFAIGLVRNRIMGVHRSTSTSLIGVFDDGLRPQKQVRPLASGVKDRGSTSWSQKRVSFYQWWNVSETTSLEIYDKPLSEKTLRRGIEKIRKQLRKLDEQDNVSRQVLGIRLASLEETLALLRSNKRGKPKLLVLEALIRQNFPVLYFINQTSTEGKNVEVTTLHRSGPEAGVEGGIEKEKIPLIAVPREKIKMVEGLAQKRDLSPEVYAVEPYLELGR